MAATEIERYKSDASAIIDIPKDLEFEPGAKPCIYGVPRNLRKVNKAAYTPQLVSIGPFHHGRPDYHPMELHKKKYFENFCMRTKKDEAHLKRFISGHYENIVRSYSVNVGFNKEKFIDMVMLDACFIIELFVRNSENPEGDYLLETLWLKQAIEDDLILLENQLPYDFLKKLCDFVRIQPPPDDAKTESTRNQQSQLPYDFLKKLCDCVGISQPQSEATGDARTERQPLLEAAVHPFWKHTCIFFDYNDLKASEVTGVKHFTDLVRQVLRPKENCEFKNKMDPLIYSATKLDSAGVKFVPRQRDEFPFAELKIVSRKFIPCIPSLNSTVLELPEIEVHDGTERLLRNVLALELCLYTDEPYICQYILLLDQLINKTEDVDFLVEKKIVKNLLGSNDAVAKLINKLADEITVSNRYYHEASKKLNDHYENPFNRTKAKIKREYFKDWWTGSVAIFGLLVLIFSFFATIKALFFS